MTISSAEASPWRPRSPRSEGPRRSIGPMLGDYEVIGFLGRGGCASVYQARHPRHGLVAIKTPDTSTAQRRGRMARQILDRFQREGELAARVAHPNVMRIIETGSADGAPYLVMELLLGDDLDAVLTRQGRLPIGAACEIVRQTLAGLGAVHQVGVVHRDLKPNNLLLHVSRTTVAAEPSVEVKLIDFGVAMSSAGIRLTQSGTIVGTPRYLAPEQARGGVLDARTDLWAAGVLLFELLTGRTPFEAHGFQELLETILAGELPDVRALRPETPSAIVAVLARAMQRTPDDRFPNARAMLDALDAAAELSGVVVGPAELSPFGQTPSPECPDVDETVARPVLQPRRAWVEFDMLGPS